ncbi:MAG: dTDP-4-dehydrorhamnose 3,5-epimerase [Limnobacter sp.]|uniref:dTDP-4-dehydrorhamnose 3,5-epimerase n=1 Tax=Limnobacter sp. TaxID=2003368 RepID=UPI0032EB1FF8
MFEILESRLKGCLKLTPKTFVDQRGQFTKVFHEKTFSDLGLETQFKEEYFSVSRSGVLRGMHFQSPPDDHVKLVYCLNGMALDVVLDIRKGSPTYGQYDMFELNGDEASCIYIPKGFAHGFYTLSDSATMVYKVSTMHSPNHDHGILWNSFGVNWPSKSPILSNRDSSFAGLESFISPFTYDD